MKCLHCGGATKVVNSRLQARNNQVWRRRQCRDQACQAIFTTEEAVNYGTAWTVRKATGPRSGSETGSGSKSRAATSLRSGSKADYQPFSPDKLLLSLYRSCQHRETALNDAAGLRETIIKKLRAEVAVAANGRTGRLTIDGAGDNTDNNITDNKSNSSGDTKLGGVIDSQTIKRTAQVALNRFDKAASVHYQAFHGRYS
jgi:transcriptional regulator NrdR family protein